MKKSKLVISTVLVLAILVPASTILAQHNQDPVSIGSYPDPVLVWKDNSVEGPNGLIFVDWEQYWIWTYEGEDIGTVTQYVRGTIDHKGRAKLIGYGTFTSTVDGLPGTIDYTIGNNWDMNTNEIWAFRMRFTGGTESFEGIKGTAKADFPYFLVYLNFNPWD
jgi:hypothetical protein